MLTIIVVVVLVTLSGLFSGLTLGLMGLNTFSLRRKAKLGDENAKKILPLRERGNLLLCTLLLGNVAVNAALSIFLGSVTAGIIAGFIATGLIVIFGEIIPQAIFARYGLKYGARFVWVVWVFLIILYPVTKPIAKALDFMLGGETPDALAKREVAELVNEQKKLKHSAIDKDDYEIIRNTLHFSDHTVRSVMTPLENIFFLNKNAILNHATLRKIYTHGHSRIPVFHHKKQNIVGILFTKDLIHLDPKKRTPVEQLMRRDFQTVKASKKLDDVLRLFQEWRTHLSIVIDSENKVVGIVTLEDVLEEIIGEIVDEHDRFVDMRAPDEEL